MRPYFLELYSTELLTAIDAYISQKPLIFWLFLDSYSDFIKGGVQRQLFHGWNVPRIACSAQFPFRYFIDELLAPQYRRGYHFFQRAVIFAIEKVFGKFSISVSRFRSIPTKISEDKKARNVKS